MKGIETALIGRSKRIWWRLSLLGAVATLTLLILGLRPGTGTGLAATKNEKNHTKVQTQQGTGSWSAPLTTSVVAIHSAMLPNGQVLMWYSDEPFGSGTGSQAELWNPITNALTEVQLPYTYDIFCAGESFLSNGQLLVTGGRDDSKIGEYGIPEATLFNAATNQWSETASMNYARWYPTNVELQDGTTLVFSGTDDEQNLVLQVESYNSQTGAWTVLPASANISPGTTVYPRMALLPSGQVFMGGMQAQSSMFNPATNTWSNVSTLNFGGRFYGAMVLLPGLEQVMEAGGNPQYSQDGTATNTVEMIDFTQSFPAWQYIAPMNYPRQNENLVLLPDGTVLAVGGGEGGGRYMNPVFAAEDYNPTTNSWTLLASQQIQRTYHSTALLLPDGRVYSGGSDNGQIPQDREIEVFSPPYLQAGARPTITSAPATLTYGQQFTIVTPDASSISRVALIKVESTTHATRFEGRFVDLTYTLGNGQITATAPPTGNYAPPGYYYLDILNSSGVPAVMPFVLLTPTPVSGVTLVPSSLTFGAQQVGTSSPPQNVTLTNTGSSTLTITSIVASTNFSQTNTCGTSVGAGASCNISVTFKPATAGTLTGTITVSDSASGSPQTVALTGTGTAPAVTLSPSTVTFASQLLHTTSPPQTVTLTNTGTATLTIKQVVVTGTDPADFAQTNTCGSSVAAGASCTFSITFTPSASGLLSAGVSISDNATGSPQKITVQGQGTVMSLQPASLNFGSIAVGTTSPPQTVTITNTGTSSVTINSVTRVGADPKDFTITSNTCGSTLGAAASCVVTLTFKPAATGSRSASLSVNDSGGGSPQTVALNGTGT
jgi:hypothetical protein